jgi:hypothetical protein
MAALLAGMSLAACADILGIDDGLPRSEDASLADVQEAATIDAAADAPEEAEAEAAPPPFSPLSCGTDTCNAVSQGCCSRHTTQTDGAVVYSYACIDDDGGSCDGGQLVTCDRPDNCDKQGHVGDVCCTTVATAPVVCTSAIACDHPEAGLAYRLCEPGDDELCEPDSGKKCLPSASSSVGWLLCK